MINALGLPLETAVSRLKNEEYEVETVETRSRKGVDGDTLRVIRQREISGGDVPKVLLTYCSFKTAVNEQA